MELRLVRKTEKKLLQFLIENRIIQGDFVGSLTLKINISRKANLVRNFKAEAIEVINKNKRPGN